MNFNQHYDLEGKHAFLSASQFRWINYDEDRLITSYENSLAKLHGTELHRFAYDCIRLRQKLPSSKKTLNSYVNDAIRYRMTPEQVLYYSNFCFGTADAISFRKKLLRIHDLKTGVTPAHMEQLMIYASLFCLEYRANPEDIDMELRIYQSDDILVHSPSADEIRPIMDKIVSFDKVLKRIRMEEE